MGSQKLGSDCVPQREYLIDVSAFNSGFNPGNPPSFNALEITPKVDPAGYWGWYYRPCPDPGDFRNVQPRRGKFKNEYDWLGDNGWVTGPDPRTISVTHAFSSSGTFTPKVRAMNGTEVLDTFTSTLNVRVD